MRRICGWGLTWKAALDDEVGGKHVGGRWIGRSSTISVQSATVGRRALRWRTLKEVCTSTREWRMGSLSAQAVNRGRWAGYMAVLIDKWHRNQQNLEI